MDNTGQSKGSEVLNLPTYNFDVWGELNKQSSQFLFSIAGPMSVIDKVLTKWLDNNKHRKFQGLLLVDHKQKEQLRRSIKEVTK